MLKRLAAAGLAALCLAACGQSAPPQAVAPPPAPPLHIIAGSELKDLEFLRPQLEQTIKRRLVFEYLGSIDMIKRLAAPDSGYDLAWAASDKYLNLVLPGRIEASESIMRSPVVLGLKADQARALGWDKTQPGWGDIAKAMQAGKLRFAMSNPATSNSGFSAAVGVCTALTGKDGKLAPGDIDAGKLRRVFSGVKLTADSSGWLADAYVDAQDGLDGMVNYESVILSLNAGGKLRTPLVPVYPKEGSLSADYPLMLLKNGPKVPFDQLVALLRSEPFQRQIMQHTLRRPVATGVELLPLFGSWPLRELPFPASREMVDAIIATYPATMRGPDLKPPAAPPSPAAPPRGSRG